MVASPGMLTLELSLGEWGVRPGWLFWQHQQTVCSGDGVPQAVIIRARELRSKRLGLCPSLAWEILCKTYHRSSLKFPYICEMGILILDATLSGNSWHGSGPVKDSRLLTSPFHPYINQLCCFQCFFGIFN